MLLEVTSESMVIHAGHVARRCQCIPEQRIHFLPSRPPGMSPIFEKKLSNFSFVGRIVTRMMEWNRLWAGVESTRAVVESANVR